LRQLLARPASPSSLRRYSLPAGRQGVLRGAFTLSLPNVPIYPEPVEGPAAPPKTTAVSKKLLGRLSARII